MNKKAISIALILIATVGFTGCEKDPLSKLSKKELINLANNQTVELEAQGVRVVELETLLKGIQKEDSPTAAISTMGDGTGRLTFNSIADKIVFPVPFEYPGSTQAANSSSINISSNLSISPTNNWITVLNGTTLELNHTGGISGMVKAGYIENIYDRTKLQEEIMSKFFNDFPPEKITYSKLFLNDQWWGLEAKVPTLIDGEPAYLRAGMLGLGEQSFTYVFVYKGEKDAGKDETVLALLKTIKMLGQNLSVE